MSRVCVIGVGTHPWGKFDDRSFIDLGERAVRNALADAGVSWSEIPAVVSGIYVWGGTDALNAGNSIAALNRCSKKLNAIGYMLAGCLPFRACDK